MLMEILTYIQDNFTAFAELDVAYLQGVQDNIIYSFICVVSSVTF